MLNNMQEIINDINKKLDLLNENNIPVRDIENDDFRISKVKYDSEKDEVYFECETA